MIKVHFAGCEGQDKYASLVGADVHYALYSAYSYIRKKKAGDDMRLSKKDDMIVRACNYFNSTIQDSGLFTMMFGAGKGGKYDRKFMEEWQDRLIQFVLQNKINPKIVELDCQKVLGVAEAWHLRERMRQRLPNHTIINVFHFDDGKKGLDRLIEYSDYIAVSVPEWRIVKSSAHKKELKYVTSYIKEKKPSIDIHLLGCTSLQLLKENKFCTSADSTSWMYGFMHRKISDGTKFIYRKDLNPKIIKERAAVLREIYEKDGLHVEQEKYEKYAIQSICASAALAGYVRTVGNQK